jgi:DNA primase
MTSPTVVHIKAHAPILDVAGHFSEIKRTGHTYMCNCPLHTDKTPSLSINPTKGLWRCFSCGNGGDSIKLVQEAEGLSFIDACKWLIETFNIPEPQRMRRNATRNAIKAAESVGDLDTAKRLMIEL